MNKTCASKQYSFPGAWFVSKAGKPCSPGGKNTMLPQAKALTSERPDQSHKKESPSHWEG